MDFRETSIEYIANEQHATFYSSEAKWKRKIHSLKKDYPNDIKIIHEDEESLVTHIPKSWFKITPPRKMNLSEEQRLAAAERMSNARKKKGTS